MTPRASVKPVLIGDIGGTHTRLALAIGGGPGPGPRPGHTPVRVIEQLDFDSKSGSTLETIAADYLRQTGARPSQAVFGIAGPVVGGRVRTTNLPWMVTEAGLRRAMRLRSVRLINDLVAIAWAVPALGPKDVLTVNRGSAVPDGTIAVIAPGTGLGEAYAVWEGGRYRPYPSEGGHADFAPPTPLAGELLDFLRRSHPHVSVEWVCSGTGIPHIYEFLRARGEPAEPAWLAERIAAAEDPSPVIVSAALDAARPCPIADATLDLFIAILGAEAGNLALKVLATGGVYLAGGIPPQISGAVRDGRLLRAFTAKGRMSDVLSKIPVRLVVHRRPGLIGAAVAASYL